MPDLFATAGAAEPWDEMIAPGSVLLRGFALPFVDNILVVLGDITAQAPFRHMKTPWGAAMSVAMTNCGDAGWLTDRAGYRYDRVDPQTGQPWPVMPECFRELASRAADPEPCRGSGRLSGFRAGCVPHQPLCSEYQAEPAPGPGRARLCAPDCLGVVGSAGHLPVRRAEAPRCCAELRGAAWRCGSVGRCVAARLSRRGRAEERRASASWQPAHQPDIPPGVMKQISVREPPQPPRFRSAMTD
jgi:hypothetical protein